MDSKLLMRMRRTPPAGLGPLLRSARARACLTQGEAARDAGIPQPYLSMLEGGLRVPSEVVARALAATLRLNLDECGLLYSAAVNDAGRSHPHRTNA
jgi:transcriptional regulator with XRE-family HTH domain